MVRLERVFIPVWSLAIFFCSSQGALAAGGEIPTLVQEIGLSLFVAGGLAVLFARLNIPSIAAFILAGVLVGPQVLHLVTETSNIDAIAQIGFVLLLFVIGLEIDVRSLLAGGKPLLVAGVVQYPLTLLLGLGCSKLLIVAGLGGVLEEMPLAPLYMGLAIAGSSSLLVVKLFQENFQLDTQPGRISLIILIFQDVWAIIVTILQPSLHAPDLAAIATSFLGIGILIVIAAVLARYLIGAAFRWIAKKPELILLGAVSWCFAVVAIGTNLDNLTIPLGFNLHIAVSSGMAALVAGATIASLPFTTEIVTKVSLVKDFFITLFFVGLGMNMPALTGWDIPLLALALALLAILARQLVFFPVFYVLGVDQRSAQVSSIRLAQISEFGLVIAFLGMKLGHISQEIGSVIILAFVITAVLTTPLFEKAYGIYAFVKPALSALGFKEPSNDTEETGKKVTLAVLGIHREASSFLYELGKSHPEILPETVVVDFNMALHKKIRDLGVHVEYGDISNEETLIHAGVDRAKIIVCTISDDLLRGINTQELVRVVRRLNPEATIVANAINLDGEAQVREAGANIVYMSRLAVADKLIDALHHILRGEASSYAKEHVASQGDLSKRDEVMN